MYLTEFCAVELYPKRFYPKENVSAGILFQHLPDYYAV